MRVLVALALLGVSAAGADGQAVPPRAEFWLPADHWVHPVLTRLSALGLGEGEYEPALPGVDRVTAARLLGAAAESARTSAPAMVAVLEGYRARLEGEFPQLHGATGRAWTAGLRLGADAKLGDPDPLTSVGTPPLIPQPWEPDPAAEQPGPFTDPRLVAEFRARYGQWLAAQVTGVAAREGPHLGESYVSVASPRVSLWAGRRGLRLGYGAEGVVVSGRVPLDGVGVVVRPFELPWLLGAIGAIDISTSLAQLHHSAPYDDPWLWLLRVGVRPHERFSLALHRAAMAVPVEGGFGDRLQQIAYIAIGKHLPDADENWRDNQMASVALRFRPPLGPVPLEAYLEWGLDDSAGSWKDVPGIIGGAYLGALPGVPRLGAGFEVAHFAPRCCGNIWWYRHTGFQGGWTDERQPLGHQLGGHGDQWTVRLDGSPGGAVEFGGSVFRRNRGDENLFAPTFQGESTGAAVRASGVLPFGVEIGGAGEHEAGEGWDRSSVRLWARWSP